MHFLIKYFPRKVHVRADDYKLSSTQGNVCRQGVKGYCWEDLKFSRLIQGGWIKLLQRGIYGGHVLDECTVEGTTGVAPAGICPGLISTIVIKGKLKE
jgi:hypothetical protein